MASNAKLLKVILSMEDKMTKQLNNSIGKLDKVRDRLNSIGTKMSIGVTAPLVAAGAGAVKVAANFETAMKNIQVISHQTDAEIASLGDQFLKMSSDIKQTVDSPQQLAEAFYDIQSAGFAAEDGLKVLSASTKAAAGGLSDTKTAADAVTSILNAYQLGAGEAEHVTDLMLKTVERGKTTFGELASTISQVTPIASSANIGLEQVSATIATLTAAGVETSMAMTQTRSAMIALLKPNKEMSAAIKDLGYESGQALINAKGFGGALNALADAANNNTDELLPLFGRIEGVQAALGISGKNAQAFTANLAEMGKAAGTTAEAFAIQSQTFANQMKNLKNNLQVLGIQVGNILIPALNTLIGIILPIVQAFSSLPEPVKKVIVIIGLLAAAVGPVMLVVSGLIGGFSALIGIVTALAPIVGLLVAGFAALNLPLILAAGAVLLIATNFGKVKEIASGAWDVIKGIFSGFIDGLGQIPKKFGELISYLKKEGLGGLVEIFKAVIEGLVREMVNFVKKAFDKIKGEFNKGINSVKNFLGIHSPSRVTAEIGRMMGEGFVAGFAQSNAMGRIAQNAQMGAQALQHIARPMGASASNFSTNLPSTFRAFNPNSFQAIGAGTPGFRPILSGRGGGGGVNIQNLNVPPGTTPQQVDILMREFGKRIKKQGGYGLRS